MSTIYWITENGWVAYRVDGDPLSDGFFEIKEGVKAWLEKKRAAGARITYLSPPRIETWGGPHFGWTEKVRVIAVVEEAEA